VIVDVAGAVDVPVVADVIVDAVGLVGEGTRAFATDLQGLEERGGHRGFGPLDGHACYNLLDLTPASQASSKIPLTISSGAGDAELSLLSQEQSLLRAELRELKKCQLQYFLVSIGATGGIWSIGDKMPIKGLGFLFPLVIVLPCWVMFFDKATSITRLAGFISLLEGRLKSRCSAYVGYENALRTFRVAEDKAKQRWDFYSLRHRYWIINWTTYFVLSMSCCALPLLFGLAVVDAGLLVRLVYGLSLSAVLVCTLYTFLILRSLRVGGSSYKNMAEAWRDPSLRL
jgi:hypothetical protein